MRLRDKRVLVTGGSSGIGLEAAKLFHVEGAEVAILGRDEAKLARAVAEVGPRARALRADVAQREELGRAIAEAGQLDVLFVNAGVSETPELAATTEAEFDAFLAVNVKGVFFCVQLALPQLRDGASIILTGSVAARKGRPGDPLYAASKGAVRSFGRALAMDAQLLARRVRVNVLTPGAIATPLTAAATEDPAVRHYIAAMVPMGRWGTAREVAEAALFLASDASSYMTGGELTVDGGLAHG